MTKDSNRTSEAPTPNEILPMSPRPSNLDGLVLGLVDNGNPHGRAILERIARNLAQRYSLKGARYLKKRDASLPPDPEEVESLAKICGAVVAAIGD